MVAEPAVAGGRFRTRGHDGAVAAVRAMIAGRAPHALLIGGPAGIGKTTLARDLAAGLLCDDPDPSARPCRACRGCRLVDRGIHPDLHRVVPSGPGDQIRIGSRDRPEDGTIRRLALDLVLLSVEGGARVAIVERADRMGDDAQTALLKTLEEPPAGVTIVLCADDEDRLMPTVRSRCARIRLGSVAVRDIETILAEAELAEPPTAARLARLAGGRPGLARSLARSPDAIATRDETARRLLDLLSLGPAARLAASREVTAAATSIDRALQAAAAADEAAADGDRVTTAEARPARRGGRVARGPARAAPDRPERTDPASEGGSVDLDEDATDVGVTAQATAAQRRRATGVAVGLWRDLTRDLLVTRLGAERDVRDPGLLDDLRVAAAAFGEPGRDPAHDPAARSLTAFLKRLDDAGELLEANVRPELVLDALLLAWPTVAVDGA